MHAWGSSPGHILVQDKLVGGTACVESVFPRSTSVICLLWLFPSLQAFHLPAFERTHAFVCQYQLHVQQWFPPARIHLWKLGYLVPSLLALTRLVLALLVWSFGRLPFLWEADIPVGHAWSSPSLSPRFRCGTSVRLRHFSTPG